MVDYAESYLSTAPITGNDMIGARLDTKDCGGIFRVDQMRLKFCGQVLG